ncbi:MAG: multifunctional oxoglutarate decarboxylase/oxoglutarate dehydrogenase thiamine pyrophosphate-binding subunit/dihydrolipoyllysine-residue succinyltransferase subunit [Ignavibacterium sp.]
MEKKKISKEEKEELEKFGANTWFVESLYEQFLEDPNNISEQWQQFFNHISGSDRNNNNKKSLTSQPKADEPMAHNYKIEFPKPMENDELKLLVGSAAKVIDNMYASLLIPVASSQRSVPVRLLEENRIIINNYFSETSGRKISFTHLIGFAIIQAIKKYKVMNNTYTEINGKANLIIRKHINLGIAIDLEKKDGSRSLIVPNIKNSDTLNFKEFLLIYDDLIKRSRSGQINPDEFLGTTITLTNPGTLGTVSSIPRLMMGQGTIIATGAIQYPTEYQAMSAETISTLGISKVLTITSTYDHRIIQGAESGLFLKEISELLLGKDNFYEKIFEDLNIPLKPISWETDVQPTVISGTQNTDYIEKQARIMQLINMYRVRGHLIANLDPLGINKQIYHPELDPSFHKLTLWDLDRTFITGGFGGIRTASLRKILDIIKNTYCKKIGAEFMHIQSPVEKTWLQNKMEPIENKYQFSNEIEKAILLKLIEAESFEHFIHNRFIGHKRFSLEGAESLIPILDFLMNQAAEDGVEEIVLGMSHRGRLNVLANIIGKSFDSILSEFEDIVDPESYEGSGDVKYHLGAMGNYTTRNGKSIAVSVASNPSHLEWVNPVVEGIVRAKQTRKKDIERKITIPVLIHGDAAFAGQGIVAETLNLSQLKGYRTGGTIHIIINNQIGFTTTPDEARSSVYASDIAKMVQAPIFHVNSDDPEAVLWTTKLAFEYRQEFHKDVVIDLICYRRHGHNEGDEPGFTQPILYEKIKSHPSVMTIYSQRLIKEEKISEDEISFYKNEYEKKLNNALERIKKKHYEFKIDIPLAVSKEKLKSQKISEDTNVSENILNEIILRSTILPEDFSLHPKLNKFLERRREFVQNNGLADWALGEFLAFGSLLYEGIPIRLSGQDSVRGTFSQRHLALTDLNTGNEYFPINHLFPKQAKMEALDSLLSEAGVLGFEYGYSIADPLTLVIWEAQFGDFANSAQVIIDNFIVASYEKWQQPNNLVMLLPHGYEGQGPEHSSARLERFLILSAQNNIEVCYPSTPSQYFHLLRRHMKKGIKRPLVIMTPKSLLRLPEARSSKIDFVNGSFKEIIDDETILNKNEIEKIILTSGKVFYELLKYRNVNKINNVSIIRIEQFYPFEKDILENVINSYNNIKKVLWVQEEPKNMGAWNFLHSRLLEIMSNKIKLKYVGRPESASPGVGSARISQQQQEQLIKEAFTI